MYKILIVDDDDDMLELLADALEIKGYLTTLINDPTDVLLNEIDSFDLIILDVMMPNIGGIDLCHMIRDRTTKPIIFLTAKSDDADIISGLDIGADDYICKPFSMDMLYARINALLRREFGYTNNKELVISDITINLSEKKMYYKDTQILLTGREFELCLLFASYKNKVFSKEEIYNRFYDVDSDTEYRVITQYIYQIRQKFMEVGIDPIKSVWGIGYQWK